MRHSVALFVAGRVERDVRGQQLEAAVIPNAVRTLTIAIAALPVTLVCAPAAWGAAQPFAGGQTRLELNRGLDSALRQQGVAIKSLGPAQLKGRKLTLPVASGTFDRDAGSATFVQSGGLKLVSGRKAVALRGLMFDASTKGLSATVAGKRMRLAHLAGAKLEPDGFDARLKVKRLPLTRAAAAAVNRALGLGEALRPGSSLGSVNGLGEPSAVQIASGKISLGGPDTAFSKLESLQVQMGIWGASERWKAPGETYFLFEIEPTTVTPDALAGILEGDPSDGVTLEIHAPPPRNMLLRAPRIDLAAQELSATVSALSTDDPVTAPIATLDYSGATFQVRPKVGAFELIGIRAVANQFIADRLNERFATPGLFQAGETLARITVILRAL
jgi:hypothetical protein